MQAFFRHPRLAEEIKEVVGLQIQRGLAASSSPSASPSATNILRAVFDLFKTPITAGIRAKTSALR